MIRNASTEIVMRESIDFMPLLSMSMTSILEITAGALTMEICREWSLLNVTF